MTSFIVTSHVYCSDITCILWVTSHVYYTDVTRIF